MSKLETLVNILCQEIEDLKEDRDIIFLFLEKYKDTIEKIDEISLYKLGKIFKKIFLSLKKDLARTLDEFSKEIEKFSAFPSYVDFQSLDYVSSLVEKLKKRNASPEKRLEFKKTLEVLESLLTLVQRERDLIKKDKLCQKIENLLVKAYLLTISESKKIKLKKILLKYLEDYPWNPETKEKTLKAFIKKFVLKELKYPHPRISIYNTSYNFHKE